MEPPTPKIFADHGLPVCSHASSSLGWGGDMSNVTACPGPGGRPTMKKPFEEKSVSEEGKW